MPRLHLISTLMTPEQIKICWARFADSKDAMLLIGDAVLLPLEPATLQALLDCSFDLNLLKADWLARGLQNPHPAIKQLSDQEMVDKVLNADKLVSW